MLLESGIRSPTFQPHFAIMRSPTSAPARSRMKASRACGLKIEVAVVELHVALRIDREDDEEVLRILVVAAEPVGVRHLARRRRRRRPG